MKSLTKNKCRFYSALWVFMLITVRPTYSCELEHAQKLIDRAYQTLQEFDQTSHWDSVKKIIAVSDSVLILPSGASAGFLIGSQWGRGVLLKRHDTQWSDPVYVEYRAITLGFLGGVQQVSGVGAILDPTIAGNVADGRVINIGGTADFTVGKGISGQILGGLGGISTMKANSASGLFFGGSMDVTWMKLNNCLNRALYGVNYDTHKILDNNSPRTSASKRVISKLEQISSRLSP